MDTNMNINVNVNIARPGTNDMSWNGHVYEENMAHYRESQQFFQMPSHTDLTDSNANGYSSSNMNQYSEFQSFFANAESSVAKANNRSNSQLQMSQKSPVRRGSLSEGHANSPSGMDLQMMLTEAAKRAEMILLSEDLESFAL